jgi:hypothetical protein
MSINEWDCANEYSKSEDWMCAGLMKVCFSANRNANIKEKCGRDTSDNKRPLFI